MITRITRIFYFSDTRKDFKDSFLDVLKIFATLKIGSIFTLKTQKGF